MPDTTNPIGFTDANELREKNRATVEKYMNTKGQDRLRRHELFVEDGCAIKTVNALSHYTDWTIGHVHAGALGWVAMVSIGSLYHLIPKVFGREKMYSLGLINAHFWLATIGTVLYIASMWVNGITQGLMWRAGRGDSLMS